MNQETKTSIPRKDTKTLSLASRKKRKVFPLYGVVSERVLVLFAAIVGIALLFPYSSAVQTIGQLRQGEVAKETIIAPFTFDIIKSPEELKQERERARSQVLQVVRYDGAVNKQVREKTRSLQKQLLRLVDVNTADSLKSIIRADIKKELSDNTVETLVERMYLLDDALLIIEQTLNQGVPAVLLVPSVQVLGELRTKYNTSFDNFLVYKKNYVTIVRDTTEKTVALLDIPVKEIALEEAVRRLREERRFDVASLNCVYELLSAYLQPNVFMDEAETENRREKAADDVLKTKGKVIKDTEIVRKHQEVTGEIADKIRSLQLAITSLDSNSETQRIVAGNIARVMLTTVPLLFLAFYVVRSHPRVAREPKHCVALAAILVFQIAVMRVGMLIVPKLFDGNSELTQVLPEFLIPVTIGAMLVTILFNIELGLVVSIYAALFFGIAEGFNFSLFMFALLSGLVAGFVTKDIRYRWDFFKAIPPVFAVSAIMVVLLQVSGHKLNVWSLFQNTGLSMINAITATFVAMMTTAVFENLFDITTNMTLVELSDMNNPILKRLSIEAAGTYNHSVLVANLAESAAAKIGANSLLARVSSYYHDIGKLGKMEYYIENVLNNDRNKHNKLSPNMSALIISSHVKEGVDMARKQKLPSVIIDAILQHHGTSLVSFFFEKAREQDPHKQVQEKDFRYPGPRPQSRENAIIMLADSVEAASRSLATSSPRLLRELVRKIIRDKFVAGQLDQCDLTLRDLDEIVEGFMPVLQGIFHTRIEYPNK